MSDTRKMDVPAAVRTANAIIAQWRGALADGLNPGEYADVLRMDLDTLREAMDVISDWAPLS